MTETVARLPQVGEAAPDFKLASTSGERVTLSSFVGHKNVLIAFFPLAFTSTCTKELCAFSEDFDVFTEHGVEVLPISVDAVPSLREFKKALGLKVDLLSDFRRDASRAYGVLQEHTFHSSRAYFLVDKEGALRWMHTETVSGQFRPNAEIFAEIAKLAP